MYWDKGESGEVCARLQRINLYISILHTHTLNFGRIHKEPYLILTVTVQT